MNVTEGPKIFTDLRIATVTSDVEVMVFLIPIQGAPTEIEIHPQACGKIHNAYDDDHTEPDWKVLPI